MGEYRREQRNQGNRAIANNGAGNRPLKKIVDNRINIRGVIQEQKDVIVIATGERKSVSDQYQLRKGEKFVTGKSYPLGFNSEQQFRDLTRSLARKYRGSTIIVSGSSVTGYKYLDPKIPFRATSDIDMGVVGAKPAEVNKKGFPRTGTALSEFEQIFRQSMIDGIHHPTGIKFFSRRPQRKVIVRSHTPEPERGPDG
ncbi:hypothetical protein [Bacteroides fragilis]|jgi:hypothetical protein|uniref:hypothetical protein n=1 Tax=Bacteroides fragilis TaxID=817 RepID=UPI00202DE80B|nr:hypothetical protein [Bacteroides fragilis]MCM0248051.1 hypothetical protein [Bacteroides fragilis]MCM0256838.1 hypothetical protein [Bacteroides fragilis]